MATAGKGTVVAVERVGWSIKKSPYTHSVSHSKLVYSRVVVSNESKPNKMPLNEALLAVASCYSLKLFGRTFRGVNFPTSDPKHL